MKMKQKNKTIKPSEFDDMVNSHKNREINPPATHHRDEKTGEVVRTTDKVEALQTWFKTAKDPAQSGQSAFLGVDTQDVKLDHGTDRQQLYKGKKK